MDSLIIYKSCGEIDKRVVLESPSQKRNEYIDAVLGATTKNKNEEHVIVIRIVYGNIEKRV